MRFWDRIADPDIRMSRVHATMKKPDSPQTADFGQKPLFGVPSDETDKVDTNLPFEAELDHLVPSDESPGNSNDPVSTERPNYIIAKYRVFNVSATPTSAEFDAAFGLTHKVGGFVGVLKDSSSVMYVVVSNGTDWFYEKMTRAV